MFDFFKDVYYEIKGIDSSIVREEQKKKQLEAKKDRFIFSKSAKVLVFIFGILYLVMSMINIAVMIESGEPSAIHIVRVVLLSLCDIACLICLAINEKKTEIAALILMFVFVIAQYFTLLIM